MTNEIETFLDKVDAFAQGLDKTEQAMLAHLVRDDDDEVAGFNFYEGWPSKISDIAPRGVADLAGFRAPGPNTDKYTDPGRVSYTDAGRFTGG